MKDTPMKGILKIGAGAAGVLMVLAILVAVNIIVAPLRLRVDLTEEKLYTLSKGSRQILGELDGPVTLKYYFSRSSGDAPMHLKEYASQVEDLLKEYEVAGKGKLILEVYDPEPDSDEEEWARRYGVAEQPTGSMFGPPIYFGVVAAAGSSDGEAVIPALSPRTESTLEYDLTRLIARVGDTKKPVLGVISSLPVMGSPAPNPMMMAMQPQNRQPAWTIITELKRDYDVRELDAAATTIDSDVDALLLFHPKALSDSTVYAIDQFVLRGGHLMAFLDPFSMADAQANPSNPMMGMQRGGKSSDLPALLKAWGVDYDENKVVADTRAITTLSGTDGQPEESAVFLSLGPENLDRDDLLTSQLESVMLAFAGAFADQTDEGLTFTPLIQSSEASSMVDASSVQFGMQAYRSQLNPSGTRKTMAARLSGTFKTAFPDGPPPADEGVDAPAPTGPAEHLSEGQGTVLLFGDVDLLVDRVCVRFVRDPFGGQYPIAQNDNLALAANAVEQMSGSEALIAIRSRGTTRRQFTYVDEIEMKAARQGRDKLQKLNDKLQETQQKISALQTEKQGNQRQFLSEAQKEEIAAFREEEYRVKQELKEVRKNLRKEIKDLGVWVKVLNIAVIPVLVIIFGVGYGVIRRRR